MSTGDLVGKPVALWNASPSGGEYAQQAILETLRTMNWQVVEDATRIKPFVRSKIAGEVTDEATLAVLRESLRWLLGFASDPEGLPRDKFHDSDR